MISDSVAPRHVRRRDFPGWRMVWALSVTETISHGVLYYVFAAFLLPMQQELHYSLTALTGAFSLCVLVTGVAAVPIGAWLDRHGARGLMTVGSILATGCVVAWAAASSLVALYVTFIGIGLASAAVLYEPAFATINAYFATHRRTALLTLTMAAGLASTIFLPTAALLISHLGWRTALLVLAGVQATTILPHALLLRRRPSDHGWHRDGVLDDTPQDTSSAGDAPEPVSHHRLLPALMARPVALLTAGAVLSSVASAAVAVHLLPYLREHGYSTLLAATATGSLGVVQVLGRVVLTVSARWLSTAGATALMLVAQVVGVAVLLLVGGPIGVVAFVVLFGLGFGLLSIARPDLLAHYAPRGLYARLSGIQALLVVGGEAVGPTGASILRTATGGYTTVFLAVAGCALGAAVLFLAADRAHRSALVGA